MGVGETAACGFALVWAAMWEEVGVQEFGGFYQTACLI